MGRARDVSATKVEQNKAILTDGALTWLPCGTPPLRRCLRKALGSSAPLRNHANGWTPAMNVWKYSNIWERAGTKSSAQGAMPPHYAWRCCRFGPLGWSKGPQWPGPQWPRALLCDANLGNYPPRGQPLPGEGGFIVLPRHRTARTRHQRQPHQPTKQPKNAYTCGEHPHASAFPFQAFPVQVQPKICDTSGPLPPSNIRAKFRTRRTMLTEPSRCTSLIEPRPNRCTSPNEHPK